MKFLLSITSFFLLTQYNISENDRLMGYWKISKMESSEMTCDLEHLDISRTAFFSKLKQQTTGWTNTDSISAEIAFNLVVDILKPMSITFKKGSVFSMAISKTVVIEDGTYTFDKSNMDLILKNKEDTVRYKILTLSASTLVLLTTDSTKAIVTYRRQPDQDFR